MHNKLRQCQRIHTTLSFLEENTGYHLQCNTNLLIKLSPKIMLREIMRKIFKLLEHTNQPTTKPFISKQVGIG
jgi:hypothetical protein